MKRHLSENSNPDRFTSLLESEGPQAIRKIVRALPDDVPSMRWRSSLNEKILAIGPIKKRLSSAAIAFRACAGVGLACALAFGLFLVQSKPATGKVNVNPEAQGLARALIFEHRDSVDVSEIAGPGITGNEQEDSDSSPQGGEGSESSEL